MVARGAGAAGPVLLACRQWDPLGLARRLPSLGVGAWRSAPLLPWRMQCPVRVCAALAASSGGSGRYLVLCLSRFPHPAPRVPRCVWRAVPSGCPLPSLAGTPLHAVCAFRELGPVALLVVPACSLRVCALALTRRPLPPPLGGVACAPRAVPALGAGRAFPRGPCPSACPAPVPCSVWRAWGGAVRSRFPPTWLLLRGASEVRRPPPPRLPAHWAGCWGPLPTCCGRGCVGVGAQHCPLGLHALWGLRAAGVVWWGAVPGGGVGLPLLCGASGVGRSPCPECPPSTRAAGAHYPLAVGAGGVRAWQPGTNPTARALASRLCALWGRHEGARGGRHLPGCGASGVGRSPTPDCPPSGRAAGANYPLAVGTRGLRAWGPVTNPTARALACCGGGMLVPGGGRLLPGCGASGVGRSPTPDCPSSGRAAGAHYPLAVGAGGCGHGDPSPTPQRALLQAGFARCGGGTRAPGRCASRLGVGRPGSGALPPPTARPLGGLTGPTSNWLWVRGDAGVQTRHQTHSALLRAGFARCGGGTRVPGGGASCLGVGRPGSGALPPPTARPLGGLPGPTTHWLWVWGGAGVGTRHQPHSALALRAVAAA